ncbi:hypothetical protein [Micromonospora sp. SL4-19]|uniref:hypothetical protein n=1 Tax=Micromonospora sp. SL4-19 TaxID=3399129 RepID=UPI003A4E32DC
MHSDQERDIERITARLSLLEAERERRQAPWYREAAVVVAILAMIASAGAAYISFAQTREQQQVAVRTELSQIIQRLQSLSARDVAAELKDDDGRLIAYSYSGDVNAENLALAEQAAVLIEKVPGGDGLSSEYLVIADAFRFSEQYSRAIELARKGLERPANATIRNGLLRLLGTCYFNLGDAAKGRDQFERALQLENAEPLRIRQWSQTSTRTYWAETERRAGNCSEFKNQVELARQLIKEMPDEVYRRSATDTLNVIDVKCAP